MKLFALTTAILAIPASSFVHRQSSSSFSVQNCLQEPVQSTLFATASSMESEAERLLKKARELRVMAAQAEQQVHVELVKKKVHKDTKTDELINGLFFEGKNIIDVLHKKKLCIDTLERIVDRLDEREVIAEGKEHVSLKEGTSDQAEFERVSKRDEEELERVQGRIDELIEAVKILDEEFQKEKETKGETYVSHTEDQHWGGNKKSERLLNRSHEIRREREEQFQERVKEFNEAQRVKKENAPPRKVKDDHGFLP